MDYNKVIVNAKKLTEKSNSNKVFLRSLKMLKINRSNFLHKLIFGFIELCLAVLMAKSFNTVGLVGDVVQVIIAIILAMLAVVFTGYAIFQALVNKKLLFAMIASGDSRNNKLSEANTYFAEVMAFQIGCVLLDLFVILFTIVLPDNWMLFVNNTLNEFLAIVAITILLYCNIESIWEMKCFIFNIFQMFNISAYSCVTEMVKTQSNEDIE